MDIQNPQISNPNLKKEKNSNFCPRCRAENEVGKKYCKKCGFDFSNDKNLYLENKEYAINKNPLIATILSILLPGAGQIYNGDRIKGLILLFVWLISIVPTTMVGWFVCIAYGALDAHDVASGKKKLGKIL